MTTTIRRAAAVLATGALALALTACGDDPEPSAPAAGDFTLGAETPQKTPETTSSTSPTPTTPTTPTPTTPTTPTTTPSTPSADQTSSSLPVAVPQEQPWAPGAIYGVQPIVAENQTIGVCTASFSFTAPNAAGGSYDKEYAVTAGHCGELGDMVYAIDGNGDTDFSKPIGQFLFSSLYPEQDPSGLDWGLIEIKGGSDGVVTPEPPIPGTIALSPPPTGGDACQYGATTQEQCGYLYSTETTTAMMNTDSGVFPLEVAYVNVCARPGDSGGPNYTVVDGNEVIMGITNLGEEEGENCLPADQEFNGVAPMWEVMDELMKKIPDAYIDSYTV